MSLTSVFTALFDGLHALKTGPLDDYFELGGKKKITRGKIR